jgi:hypothetical protein
VYSGIGGWAGIGVAAGIGAEDPTAGMGALGAFGDAGQFSTQGGVMTVFGLKDPWSTTKLIQVKIWSLPTGVVVFFVPETEFDPKMLEDPSTLARYQVQEGPTDRETLQLERQYAVVFQCPHGGFKLLRGVKVRGGTSNSAIGLKLPPRCR